MLNTLVTQAWKAQIEVALRMLETLAEGAIKIREAQLEAATQTHADLEATRKALAGAADLPQLMKLYGEWVRANAEKSAAYWRCVGQAVVETDTEVAKCVGAPLAMPEGLNLGAIDNAYKQWLEGVRRLYEVRA